MRPYNKSNFRQLKPWQPNQTKYRLMRIIQAGRHHSFQTGEPLGAEKPEANPVSGC